MAASAQGTTIIINGWEIVGALMLILWLLIRWVRRKGAEALEGLREAEREQLRSRFRMDPGYRRPGYLSAYEQGLPQACIPLPPSARPTTYVPSACRHEKILPVITLDGHHVRWICANDRCKAEFPASVAIYEAPEEAGRD